MGSSFNLSYQATGFLHSVLAGAAASHCAAGGLPIPACGDHGRRKQEYRRSWSDNSGLVNTEMFQIVKEYEIMMYVTDMPMLNQLVFVCIEMSVYTVSFPELAHSAAAWLLFRIYIP